MKIAIALFALLAGIPAMADDASRRAKAEELMSLMNVQQIQTQMFASIKQMAAQQLPKDAPPDTMKASEQVMDLIQKRMTWDNMKDSFVAIYVDSFTDEELDGILGFYKSPAGKSMLAKMPVIMQKSMGVAQKLMQEVMPEIQKITREAAEKAKAK